MLVVETLFCEFLHLKKISLKTIKLVIYLNIKDFIFRKVFFFTSKINLGKDISFLPKFINKFNFYLKSV